MSGPWAVNLKNLAQASTTGQSDLTSCRYFRCGALLIVAVKDSVAECVSVVENVPEKDNFGVWGVIRGHNRIYLVLAYKDTVTARH